MSPEGFLRIRRSVVITAIVVATFIGLATLMVALGRVDFFADDYQWAGSAAADTIGWQDTGAHAGRLLSNFLYWKAMVPILGVSSAVPYVLANVMLMAAGALVWARTWERLKRSYFEVVVASAVIAASAALPDMVLWASDVTHTLGFLLLSLAVYICVPRLFSAKTGYHPSLGAAFLTTLLAAAAVLSGPNYVVAGGLLVIAASGSYIRAHRGDHRSLAVAVLLVVVFGLVAGYVYRAMVGGYGVGAGAVGGNLRWYLQELGGSNGVVMTVAGIGVLAVVLAALYRVRQGIYVPVVVLIISAALFLPFAMQPEQRYLRYLTVPIFVLLLAGLAALTTEATEVSPSAGRRSLSWSATIFMFAALGVMVYGGNTTRLALMQSPSGSSLVELRNTARSSAGTLCVVAPSVNEAARLSAETSAGRALSVPFAPPTSAVITDRRATCPPGTLHVETQRDATGVWVVSSFRRG